MPDYCSKITGCQPSKVLTRHFDKRNIENMSNFELETTQALEVLKLFGGGNINYGVKVVADIVGRDVATIHKWKYPRSKGGTGGYVPTHALTKLKKVARLEGVLITPEHLYPEFYV